MRNPILPLVVPCALLATACARNAREIVLLDICGAPFAETVAAACDLVGALHTTRIAPE